MRKKEYFPITSVAREDVAGLGFDMTHVTNEQMERLAKYMADDYINQLYWTSLEIIAEQGIELHKFAVGDKVKWHDPGIMEFSPKDRKLQRERIWTIFQIEGDTAMISDDEGEAEVFTSELEWTGETEED